MAEVKARFDGQKIVLPDDFRAPLEPTDVTIVFPDPPRETAGTFWDFVGKSSKPMSGDEIDLYLAELRKDWDDAPGS